MDIDKLEDELGGLSRYQAFIFFSCTLFVFATGMSPQTGVIYYAVPDHRCALPTFDNRTAHDEHGLDNITMLAIPSGDSCHRYAYNSTVCEEVGDLSCLTNASAEEIINCDAGYYYDNTYFEETVVSEWDLVCSKQIWIAILNSVYFAGILIGSLPVGYMIDWYGRKFSMIVLAFVTIGSGIGCAFSPNLVVYCVFRFFEGVASIPGFGAAFTYINELTNRKSRSSLGAYLLAVAAVSHTTMPLIAFFLRDWRHLNFCLALMPIAFLTTAYFIPETPRWLLVKGRTRQARKILNRIAKSEGKNLNEGPWEVMVETEKKKQEIETSRLHIYDLFRHPFMRIVTFIVMFDWFSNICLFYGLVLSVGTLSGDPYVNAILNGATEIAAIVLYVIVSKRKGQKFTFIFGNSISGLCCIIAMIAGEIQTNSKNAEDVVRWSSIFGKLFATLAHFSLYQYTSDLFPTVTRGKAIATASTSARIGNVIVPFILLTQSKSKWVVRAILGILAISSASSTLFLPNTSSRVLTTALHEAENYYYSNMPWVARFLEKDRGQNENDASGKSEKNETSEKRDQTLDPLSPAR